MAQPVKAAAVGKSRAAVVERIEIFTVEVPESVEEYSDDDDNVIEFESSSLIISEPDASEVSAKASGSEIILNEGVELFLLESFLKIMGMRVSTTI